MFSFSAGTNETGAPSCCKLYRDQTVISKVYRESKHSGGEIETISQVVLVSLEKDDKVQIHLFTLKLF